MCSRGRSRSSTSTTATSSATPSDDVLLDLYKIAVDEYRFQVTLNWNRTQYYLVFNVGLIGIATGLQRFVGQPLQWVVFGLYVAGAVSCIFALAASHVQHLYYRAARDHMKNVEKELEVTTLGLVTTPGMGNGAKRLGSVTTMNKFLLSILLTLNILGAIITAYPWVADWLSTKGP